MAEKSKVLPLTAYCLTAGQVLITAWAFEEVSSDIFYF